MNVMTANQTTVESIAFGDLVLSPMNPRSVVSEDSIIALAANLAKVGLIQNLAGYREGNGETEVVAGGRGELNWSTQHTVQTSLLAFGIARSFGGAR